MPSKARNRRIIVVDDDPDIVESFASLLELLGHEVKRTTRAHEALELAQSFQPEIAFLDLGMPGMDGYQLAGALRAVAAESTELRLVAISGHGEAEHRAKSRKAGFDAHVRKPVDIEIIESILAQFPDD